MSDFSLDLFSCAAKQFYQAKKNTPRVKSLKIPIRLYTFFPLILTKCPAQNSSLLTFTFCCCFVVAVMSEDTVHSSLMLPWTCSAFEHATVNWPPTLTKYNVSLFWKSKSVYNLNFDQIFVKLCHNTVMRIEELTSKKKIKKKYDHADNRTKKKSQISVQHFSWQQLIPDN